MPLMESILQAIVDRVFNYLLDQSQNKIEDWVRNKLGLISTQQAFKRALHRGIECFEKKYPQWKTDLFDASFFEHEGAPLLAQFLIRNHHPDPSELAARWADSMNIRPYKLRSTLTHELEPAATYFLECLADQLKAESKLRDLNDSRAFEQLSKDLSALRSRWNADKSTPGTQRDYLRWVIDRNLYIDTRGISQRQVEVKLDKVYVSLRGLPEEMLNIVDRRVSEKELAELKARIADIPLSTEEREDQTEQLLSIHNKGQNIYDKEESKVLELAEAVIRHDRLVILGDPGSGKTTLLRYLALKHAEALWEGSATVSKDLGLALFPILIRIADYAQYGISKGKSLSDFLADYCRMHECPKPGLDDLLLTKLKEGKCLILLDGLDEIVKADDRGLVVQRIHDFVRRPENKSNRFVITSRIASYRSVPLNEHFAHYIVQDMNEVQIRYFLERWCLAVESARMPELLPEAWNSEARKQIDSIMKAVQTESNIRRLASNPLLLRTLAIIHRNNPNAEFVKKRIQLYQQVTNTLAYEWRSAQGVPQLVEDKPLTILLSKLAYWLHTTKPTGIATEREVNEVLSEEWARINGVYWDKDDPNPTIEQKIRIFLATVREQTGIFVERAPGYYGFMHLTFEEYYAARYLVARSRERAKLIRKHLHDPRWDEPILLALGFVSLDADAEDVTDLVETAILAQGEEAKILGIKSSQFEDILGRDYLFALRCLGDDIYTSPKLVRRLTDELLQQTSSPLLRRYRRMLEERLEHLNGSKGALALLPSLIKALGNANSDVRSAAALSLGHLGDTSENVLTALNAALHDVTPYVCVVAAESLRKLGQKSPDMVIVLIDALYSADLTTSKTAAESLKKLDEIYPEMSSTLINTLFNDDSLKRSAAVRGLRILGKATPEVLMALINTLNHDTNHEVRGAAAESIGVLQEPSRSILIPFRRKSKEAPPEVLMALINTLNHDTNHEVRRAAAKSLGKSKEAPPEVLIALINTLTKEISHEMRKAAAEGLGKLKKAPPEVLTALINTLNHDTNHEVRRAAAESLQELRKATPEVLMALINTLTKETNHDVSKAIAQSLRILGNSSPECQKAIFNAVHHTNRDVREEALWSFGWWNLASSEALSVLTDTLNNNSDLTMRYAAAWSLQQLSTESPEVLTILINALQKTDPSARCAAAWGFGHLKQKTSEVLLTLINTLHNDANSRVREIAAKSLGNLGEASPEVLRALVSALENDTNNKVRKAAAESIGILGKVSPEVSIVLKVGTPLLEALRDAENSIVRRDIALLIGQIGQSNELTVQALLQGLVDKDSIVCASCTQALVNLGRRFPATAEAIAEKLGQAVKNPEFGTPDPSKERHSARDYAFDALWLLISSSKEI